MKFLKKPVIKHVAIVALFITYEVRALFFAGTKAGIGDFIVFYTVDILYFYGSTFWILPNAENKDRHLLVRIIAAVSWIIMASLLVLLIRNGLLWYHGKNIDGDFVADFYISFWRRVYLFSLALGYWYIRYSVAKEREIYRVKLEVAEANAREARKESALLRSQLNPHLVYNALNHIYGLVEEKVPEAGRSILLLGDMMSLAIETTDENSLYTLKDELDQVARLIELHRNLQEDKIYINTHISVPADIQDIHFPPLLLVNLVENVFKHGQMDSEEQAANIDIKYKVHSLNIAIENNIAKEFRPGKRKGIGLENTKKRLEERYPAQFSISAITINDKFVVTLTISL